MKKYIELDELMNTLNNNECDIHDRPNVHGYSKFVLNWIINKMTYYTISENPMCAHARWIDGNCGFDTRECSCCHKIFDAEYTNPPKQCPHCHALMDRDKTEEDE